MVDYRNAISGIESGGRYDALGPVTRAGDRAYGKYQVMGANVPTWTEQALGRRLTPEQFLSDPAAQDAVFNHVFGGYVAKYGAPGAARAWFAGEKGMHNPNARDVLGTTVADYERKFLTGPGPQAGPQVGPQPGPGMSPAPQEAGPAPNLPLFSPQPQSPAPSFFSMIPAQPQSQDPGFLQTPSLEPPPRPPPDLSMLRALFRAPVFGRGF